MADLDDEQHEELAINGDKITEDISTIIKTKLAQEKWHSKKVDLWTKDIIEAGLKSMSELKKPFKFIASALRCRQG